MAVSAYRRYGCSGWTLMGCGCGLLAMIGIALVFFSMSIMGMYRLKDPVRWNIRYYDACEGNLKALGKAITRYRQDYGAPPEALTQLVPRYLSDPASLTCPLSAQAGSTPYVYQREGGPTDPIITCNNHGRPLALLHNGKLRLPDNDIRRQQASP